MSQLLISTWWWGDKYTESDVKRLHAGLRKNVKQDFTFLCFTEPSRHVNFSFGISYCSIWDMELTRHNGCFARLRMFDPGWQMQHKIGPSDRLVNIDLDVVVTGEMDKLFDRPEPFCILRGANAANPCPYNGSIMMMRGLACPELWLDFSLDKVPNIPSHEFPDDQGWTWYRLGDFVPGWRVGPDSGIYAFRKPGWPNGEELPRDARLVVFPGWRSPEKFKHLPWVKENWVDAA